jgi:Protein of unknown function (DUF1360)
MSPYIQFLILGLGVGLISLTLVKGTIFKRLRDEVAYRSDFFGELLSCPYCTSHWVAAIAMVIWHPRLVDCGFIVVDWIMTGFALVAVATMAAGIIYRLFFTNK